MTNNVGENKLIDLHLHTIYSDGELSPLELVNHVRKQNVSIFSITDHDTILGAKVLEGFKDKELKFIPGIELSAEVDTGRMHILGYGIDLSNQELNKKMIQLRERSIDSVCNLIYQLRKDYGIIFRNDDIDLLVNSVGNIGRPDVAKLLVRYGYSSTIQEGFDRFLIDSYRKVKANKGLSAEECINLILKANGIPVLAHPCTLKKSEKELLSLIKELISYGLMGLEVFHSDYSDTEKEFYLRVVNFYDLLYSGGSDFHGAFIKPDIEVGSGKNNNIKIKKLSILKQLN